jgi:hypothetical protein
MEATMRLLALFVLVLTGTTPSLVTAVQPPDNPAPSTIEQRRVRTHDARVRTALAKGMTRSAAFREVVRRVEANDVIVYIEMDPRLRGKLAGRMYWVVSTREARYVRVALNPELSGSHLIATLAHELQHVVEVGETPSVVDEPTLTTLYRGIGTERHAQSRAWDTEAAQVTGDVVRRELASGDAESQGQL